MKRFEIEKSCGCIIIDNGMVLLEKQKGDKPGTSFWCFPKGHQEKNESDIETALREVKEEIGVDVEIIDSQPIVVEHPTSKGKKVILFFLAKPKVDQKIVLQDDEIDHADWIKFGDVEQLLTYEHYKIAWKQAQLKFCQR